MKKNCSEKINRVELMPNIPTPFCIRDWRALAQAYDHFVFDFSLAGDFLPLIWWDRSHRNFNRNIFGLPSYVGSKNKGKDGSQEAINCIAAVLSATLVNIDKSNQNGHNWVLMCESFYNVDNGRWKEPESSAGISWLEYMAYVKWGSLQHLTAADWGMQFLQERTDNPTYEVLMPYGAYIAARMNAELGRSYDVQKFLNWCFDGDSDCRSGWGVIAEKWGDQDCYGLCGSITDGGGYAFTMNTFEMASALIPIVRYDSRYARAIGKWMLNAANAARLFYSDFHDARHQSCGFWTGDPDHVIAYEGLRKEWDGKSPYATGDPIRYAWGAIDFGLYGSSHVGIFGGIINRTNDEKILQLDCLKTDYYRDKAYETYLYYNPYDTDKSIEIDAGTGAYDFYDAVTGEFLCKNASGKAFFDIPADSAVVLVMTPANGEISYNGKKMLIDRTIVDYMKV